MKRRDFMFGAAAALAGGCTSAAGRKDVAMLRVEPSSVQEAKRRALSELKELGPTIGDFEIRRKKSIPGKRAAFYIDDVIWVFRDLAKSRPKSCWEHRFLGHLKEAHEKYGLKVQLNVFYRWPGRRRPCRDAPSAASGCRTRWGSAPPPRRRR